jgi:pyruvate/2-oxoglutarate dehydrogenase complex dihydrolipoamide dehydrogenase (E3) component
MTWAVPGFIEAVTPFELCGHAQRTIKKLRRVPVSDFQDLSETGWADRIATQRRVSKRLAEDLGRSLEELSVQIRFGTAKLVTPNEVEIFHPNRVGDRVSGQNIIIAPGSRPAFSSAENSKILTSEGKLASELGRSRW